MVAAKHRFVSLENEPNPHNYLCASYRYFFEQTALYMQAMARQIRCIHPWHKVEWCFLLYVLIDMNPWILLAISICLETDGSKFCKKVSDGFTKLLPTVGSLALYAISFCLHVFFRTLSVGLVYAIWSGVGIVFDIHCGVIRFGQKNRYRWADWYGIDYQRCFSD